MSNIMDKNDIGICYTCSMKNCKECWKPQGKISGAFALHGRSEKECRENRNVRVLIRDVRT